MIAAATAAKSLQSCLTLCDPIDGSPPGYSVPGILQARILEWVAISFSNAWKWKVKVNSLSCAGLLATPWTAAYQAPPSMGFSSQEYWSGLQLPSPLGMIQDSNLLCTLFLLLLLSSTSDHQTLDPEVGNPIKRLTGFCDCGGWLGKSEIHGAGHQEHTGRKCFHRQNFLLREASALLWSLSADWVGLT